MTIIRLVNRKPFTRRSKTAMAIVGAAAAVGLLAAPAFAAGSSPAATAATAAASNPEIHINYFYSEVAVPSGVSAFQWLGGPTFGQPAELFGNTTSRAVVTGTATFGSSNGKAVSGQLGVCYQPAAGGPIMFGNWQWIDFTAPAGRWVTQTISGTILPGQNGYAPGDYAVGLCISEASSNLVYNTLSGALNGSVIVATNAAA